VVYPVRLDVYEGPLDLLLQLVSKERVDVADISISTVTDDYLKATSALGEVDLETASSFLVLAATLLELKSMKLLLQPAAPDPDIRALLEERDSLLHRLVAYSTFKAAAARLSTDLERGAGFHSRQAELPEELIPQAPDVFRNMSTEQIASAAARALGARPRLSVDTSHLTPLTVSLDEMVQEMSRRISSAATTSFRELCANFQKLEVVISFLAVLELYRTESVDLEQEQPFDTITLTWRRLPPTGTFE
jgi:segregation and condensation protein A